jgi:hypothetical protein
MNPLREIFLFLYATRLKQKDLRPVFGALAGTTILAYLNLLVLTMLTDPFTGYFAWLAEHGLPTLVVVTLTMFAIGTAQYFCWVANGKLERVRARLERGASPNRYFVFAYIVLSILALPAIGTLMHNLRDSLT